MTPPLPPLPVRAVEALSRGDVIGAIKHLRAATSLDVASAKSVIDAYRHGEPWKLSANASSATSASTRPSTAGATAPRNPGHAQAPSAGEIRFPEAPEMHDAALFRDRAQMASGRSPGEVRRDGPLLRWIVVIALVAYFVYRMVGRVVHV